MTEPTPTEEKSSFTPITSQADLDTIIGNQLAQETGLPAHILAGASLEEIQAHAKALTPLLA